MGRPTSLRIPGGRVLEAIDKLGYQVNLAARTLRTSRSALVGLLVPGLHEVFAEIAQELAKELRVKGISMLMAISEWEEDGDLCGLESLQSRGVDAIVASLANDRPTGLGSFIKSLKRPVILLDREVEKASCDAVLTDQRGGVTGAVEHLWGLGIRSIGLVAMSGNTRPGREAVAAYTAACTRRHLEVRAELYIKPMIARRGPRCRQPDARGRGQRNHGARADGARGRRPGANR